MREDADIMILCFLLLVCLPNHLLVASPASSFSCHPDQRHALLRCIHSFSITGRPKVASWTEDKDCCSWEGVTCDNSTGDVVGLDLSFAGLRGYINSSSPLFSLRHLRRLSLQGNYFHGSTIPPEIGAFTRLEYLDLSNSNISGILPTEISHLSKLSSLDLSYNGGLEMQDHTMRMLIRNLTQMEELNLGYVNMSTVSPTSFMNFSSYLISLNLADCSLGGKFPEFVFGLSNLQMIDLSWNNDLTGTLPEKKWSPRLDYMSLSHCSFTGDVPNSVGNLSRLTHLDLSYNNFTSEFDLGMLSTLRFSLSKLQVLYMEYCNLTEFPSFLSRSKELKILDLSGNNIQEIAIWLGSIGIDTLEQLYVSYNIIKGSIPPSICQLAYLSSINLDGNKLTGVIPQCLDNLTNLQGLYLRNNSLSGPLPPTLANCTSLKYLDISHNSISGALPTSWLSTSLWSLDVSYNSIKGSIHPSICQLVSLFYLQLDGNKLTGLTPQCLGNLTNLLVLSLKNNSLSGPLPPSLANCTYLKYLDVSYNSIGGAPPTSWLSTSSIDCLNLRANNFVGRWPTYIFLRSVYLNYIDLSDNKFEGPLPLPSYAIESYLASNNHFSGEISSLICNATNLQLLDLSNNSLKGTLPECLRNITFRLNYLNLRANAFRGLIPEIFQEGSSLMSLDLSKNQFEGSLPRSLSNCKQLEALDIGSNKIGGSFPDWLGDHPLRVFSLRSNNFHGHVSVSGKTRTFSKVQVLDLSKNCFDGSLSNEFIGEMLGMRQDDDYELSEQYFAGSAYYSVTIDLKGIETEMVKINVHFAMLDLSSNRFQGEIPRGIRLLKSLKGLNFSHNNFTGMIPPSIGNLTNLEGLDLSSNHLFGEIPKELTKLTFLEFLNLSQNNLTGRIPLGVQFNTFSNSSFEGNPGLCGIPLTRSCAQGHKEAQPPSEGKDNREKEGRGWPEWSYVALGFGTGMGIGISLGYTALEVGRPLWLVRMVNQLEASCKKRLKRKGAARR